MTEDTYPRWQKAKIENALETRRVVLLEGPRQCGKTTLSETFVSGDAVYRTLDDATLRDSALNDPIGFVNHGDGLMVIDEVQRAPDLLLAIKMDVDKNQKYGRYLLTGSAHIQSLPTVRESLAGRIRKARLRPLAMGEMLRKPAGFIADAFEGVFAVPKTPDGHAYDKDAYISLAVRGGFPEVVRIGEAREVQQWHRDYLDVLVDRDLKDIAEIRRRNGLIRLVEVLAAWSSKEADIADIGANQTLSRPTVESYMGALEALCLVERVNPWHSRDYDRLKKHDKVFMADSGFMSSMLQWTVENVRLDGDRNGKLIETFVFNQLSAILDAQEENYRLHYYRDREGREVDLLIQNEAGGILGVEVKAGSSVDKSTFKHMEWFKGKFARDADFIGVVLYSGEHVVPFGEGMWAVPICALWA